MFELFVAIKSWLVGTAANNALKMIVKYLKSDRLIIEIQNALSSSSEVIQPPPNLIKDRLTDEVSIELIKAAISQDNKKLSEFLINEQIISLPMHPENKPDTYDPIWNCISDVVLKAVGNAIVNDSKIERAFNLYAHQLASESSNQNQAEIQAGLQAIRDGVSKNNDILEGIAANLDISGKEHQKSYITEPASMRTINLLSDQNELLEQQLRDQLDEESERLWDKILNQIAKNNFHDAISKGIELAEWIDSKEAQLSNQVKGRTYLLLAHIALIETTEWGNLDGDLTKSRNLFEQAKDAFGDVISTENLLRITNFEAKLLSIDGHDDALELLPDATDAQTIATRLQILIDARRYTEATEVVQELPIDSQWCELAVFAYARAGDEENLTKTLSWASSDNGTPILLNSCRIAFGKASLLRLLESHGDTYYSVLSHRTEDTSILESIIANVSPLVDESIAKKSVESGLHADAIGISYNCNRLLKKHQQAISQIKLLQTYRPVHLDYATAVVREDLVFSPDLAKNLRDDYPKYFVARDLALVLDLQSSLDLNVVLDHAKDLEQLAKSKNDREKLARLVTQIGMELDDLLFAKSYDLIIELVGKEHLLIQILESQRLFRAKKYTEFEESVGKLKDEDDYLLDQLRAQLLIHQGKRASAAEILERVGRKLCEPELLINAAGLALDARPRQLDIVISSLEAAIAILPGQLKSNRMLAYAYIQLQAFPNAAECFARMRTIDPSERLHALNHARCFIFTHQPKRSLEIYEELCELDDPPIEALLGRAKVLADCGEATNGFQTLHCIRTKYWNDTGFLEVYITLAHAANQDLLANNAYKQLWKLQESGRTATKILQPKSPEDLIEYCDDAREERNFLLDQTIAGKLPWLLVESFLNNVPYWAWRIRTQPMSWYFDDTRSRASFSIYATNGYAVLKNDNTRILRRIKCSEKNKTVAVDLTSLITLHRLNLIDSALEYFTSIKLPPVYMANTLTEAGKLRPHQLSQKMSLLAIKSAIDSRKISASIEDNNKSRLLDEYCTENQSKAYRIKDLIILMHKEGAISNQQENELLNVAHKDARHPESKDSLQFSDPLVVALSTLKTLTEQGLLDKITDAFDKISITENDIAQINQEIKYYSLKEETLSWHIDLWEFLRDDVRVDCSTLVLETAIEDESEQKDEENASQISATASMLLAKQEEIPLLTDDRVCQNILLQADGIKSSAAFGTDRLIVGLLDADIIDLKQADLAFRQLLDWRYRFIVIPHKILFTIATESSEQDLRKIACYVHDCMRDPGLFGGFEPSDIPTPMAFRFYQDWLEVIAKFIALLWMDSDVSEEKALKITTWATTEFIPTIPKSLGERMSIIANFSAFTVLNHAMVQLCDTENYKLANTALRCIADGLGFTDEEYIRITADIIDSYGQFEQ